MFPGIILVEQPGEKFARALPAFRAILPQDRCCGLIDGDINDNRIITPACIRLPWHTELGHYFLSSSRAISKKKAPRHRGMMPGYASIGLSVASAQ